MCIRCRSAARWHCNCSTPLLSCDDEFVLRSREPACRSRYERQHSGPHVLARAVRPWRLFMSDTHPFRWVDLDPTEGVGQTAAWCGGDCRFRVTFPEIVGPLGTRGEQRVANVGHGRSPRPGRGAGSATAFLPCVPSLAAPCRYDSSGNDGRRPALSFVTKVKRPPSPHVTPRYDPWWGGPCICFGPLLNLVFWCYSRWPSLPSTRLDSGPRLQALVVK